MTAEHFSVYGLKSIIHYDKLTGDFTNLLSGKKVGSISKQGYVKVAVFGKSYGAHRIAWFYMHGRWPAGDIDHIDGNKANNALSNLREADHFVNLKNQRKAQKGNSSGFLGVSKAPFGKWMARIRVNGSNKYLGHFETPEQAHAAYLSSKRSVHKGCTI